MIDKIYVVGGRNSSMDANEALTKSTFIYEIQKDIWSKGKDSIEYHSDTCVDSLDGKVRYLFQSYKNYTHQCCG